MVINISSGFFHSRKKKILAIFFRIFQLRTWKITVNTLTSIIFHGSFSNLARTFITLRSRTSFRSWRFCLIKNAHNGPFNEPASFGIPELIFQVKVTKFCIQVGLNMVINISSAFIHNRQIGFLAIFFSHFPTAKSYEKAVGNTAKSYEKAVGNKRPFPRYLT